MLTSIQDIRMLMITFPKKIRKRERENRLNLIRKAHNEKKEDVIRTDRMEDYLEVIYQLIQQKGYATTAIFQRI